MEFSETPSPVYSARLDRIRNNLQQNPLRLQESQPIVQTIMNDASMELDTSHSEEYADEATPSDIVPTLQNAGVTITTKGWSLATLLKHSSNFRPIKRVPYETTPSEIARVVEDDGEPLVLQGWQRHPNWPHTMFHADFLQVNHGTDTLSVRNVKNFKDAETTLAAYIDMARNLDLHTVPEECERLYAKDLQCPPMWSKWLQTGDVIPIDLVPLNRGDLLLNLPKELRPETLMCYLGVGDTFTPTHKDLCGSVGHNIMCYTENNGSAFWFTTKSSAAPLAASYIKNLGYELDCENHTMTLDELAKAPFEVYVCEQKEGDLVLVPPRSVHQVVNNGGITIKTSWSRMTVKSLDIALRYELTLYRRVCRAEVYRCKLLTFFTVQKLSDLLDNKPETDSAGSSTTRGSYASNYSVQPPSLVQTERYVTDLKAVLKLYEDILVEEWYPEVQPLIDSYQELPVVPTSALDGPAGIATLKEKVKGFIASTNKNGERNVGDSSGYTATCDFCKADIFQSFFVCENEDCHSTLATAGKVDICPGCYCEGRSCECGLMLPVQLRDMEELLEIRDRALVVLRRNGQRLANQKDQDDGRKRWIVSSNHPRLFSAACILLKKRRTIFQSIARQHTPRLTRSCRKGGGSESHSVAWDLALVCKECHTNVCFQHLLERGIHAWEAIVKNDDLHHIHRIVGPSRLIEAQNRSPSVPEWSNAAICLAFATLANSYSTVATRGLDALKSGFYDVPANEFLGHSLNKKTPLNSISRKDKPKDHSISLRKGVKRRVASALSSADDELNIYTPDQKARKRKAKHVGGDFPSSSAGISPGNRNFKRRRFTRNLRHPMDGDSAKLPAVKKPRRGIKSSGDTISKDSHDPVVPTGTGDSSENGETVAPNETFKKQASSKILRSGATSAKETHLHQEVRVAHSLSRELSSQPSPTLSETRHDRTRTSMVVRDLVLAATSPDVLGSPLTIISDDPDPDLEDVPLPSRSVEPTATIAPLEHSTASPAPVLVQSEMTVNVIPVEEVSGLLRSLVKDLKEELRPPPDVEILERLTSAERRIQWLETELELASRRSRQSTLLSRSGTYATIGDAPNAVPSSSQYDYETRPTARDGSRGFRERIGYSRRNAPNYVSHHPPSRHDEIDPFQTVYSSSRHRSHPQVTSQRWEDLPPLRSAEYPNVDEAEGSGSRTRSMNDGHYADDYRRAPPAQSHYEHRDGYAPVLSPEPEVRRVEGQRVPSPAWTYPRGGRSSPPPIRVPREDGDEGQYSEVPRSRSQSSYQMHFSRSGNERLRSSGGLLDGEKDLTRASFLPPGFEAQTASRETRTLRAIDLDP